MLIIKKYKLFIFIGFILRICIAFWNGFYGPSPGADLDAQGLYGFAVEVSKNLEFQSFRIGYVPYINILGLIYFYTVPSLFLGSLISCFFWLFSAIIFIRILDLCNITGKNKYYAALIFSFFPTSIFLTSVTLREPYQLFLMTASVYVGLSIWYRGGIYKFILLFLLIVSMGILHGALLVSGLAIFALSVVFYFVRTNQNISFIKFFIGSAIALPIFLTGLTYSFEISYRLDDGIVQAAMSYQDRALDVGGRTDYKTYSNIFTLTGAFKFIVYGFIQYLFEPFLWHVQTIGDFILSLEGITRLLLIIMFIKNYISSEGQNQKTLLFLAICYLVSEGIWSLGTVNWGTASRHHIPSLAILLTGAFLSSRNSHEKSRLKA
jgi:hypothetical protein